MVVCANAGNAVSDRVERNEALARIGEALATLATKRAEWSEAKLHVTIRGGGRLGRVPEGASDAWRNGAEGGVGVSGPGGEAGGLAGREVCAPAYRRAAAGPRGGAFLSGKAFVEKCFRTPKTFVELEPVRQRRVRAYLFVCMQALRLQTALWWRLLGSGVEEDKVARSRSDCWRISVGSSGSKCEWVERNARGI